jgi:hypothetical protein
MTDRKAHARAFIAQSLKKGHHWTDLHYSYDFEEDGIMFLHWYEDSPKKSIAQRLAEACAAYQTRFAQKPNLILVSEQDAAALFPGCEVRAERRISPNNYQVGFTATPAAQPEGLEGMM